MGRSDALPGEVWGETKASDPIEACQNMDRQVQDVGTRYEVVRELQVPERGYEVFETLYPLGLDKVEAIEDFPTALIRENYDRVARVRVR